MNEEAETLLKIIGNDDEVGTHGAVPRFLALAQAIDTQEDAYGIFRGLKFDWQAYRQAMLELVPFLGQMSEPAFRRLMSFAYNIGLDIDRTVGEAMKNCHDLTIIGPYHREQVGKRATLIQAYARIKPPLFTIDDLAKEKEVREQYPWHWIDAMLYLSPRATTDAIINQMSQKPDMHNLYIRVPSFVNQYGLLFINKLASQLKEVLPPEQRQDLIKFMSGYARQKKRTRRGPVIRKSMHK